MKKINFLQKKYMLPLIVLPFIVGIAYMLKDFKKAEKKSDFVEMDDLNAALQDPKSKSIKSKMDALTTRIRKDGDFSGIQNVEKEHVVDEMVDGAESLYTTDEMRKIDSLNQVNQIKREEIQRKIDEYKGEDFGTSPDEGDVISFFSAKGAGAGGNDQDKTGTAEAEETGGGKDEIIERQRKMMDSILQVRERLNGGLRDEKDGAEEDEPETVLQVRKGGEDNRRYFNTACSNEAYAISAILDESVNVVAGSRVRIRLLENVRVGKHVIKSGQCLYGTVNGFNAQRVKINVKSVLVNGKPLAVNLSVYDLDGMEGFYVPRSAFRDFTKQAGSRASQQNINISSGNDDGNVQKFMYRMLQDLYRSGSQAVGKNIRQNKANLKYASQILLINQDEKQQKNEQ